MALSSATSATSADAISERKNEIVLTLAISEKNEELLPSRVDRITVGGDATGVAGSRRETVRSDGENSV